MDITDTTCTTREFAEFINRTMRHVQQMISDEVLSKNDDGELDFLTATKDYITHLQDALKYGGSENGEIARARARYEIARAEEKELEVAKLLGDVVLADDVQESWNNAASNWKVKILALPAKIALRTQAMNDRQQIEDIISELVESTLTEIALYGTIKQDTKQTKTPANARNSKAKSKATTKTNRKSVG